MQARGHSKTNRTLSTLRGPLQGSLWINETNLNLNIFDISDFLAIILQSAPFGIYIIILSVKAHCVQGQETDLGRKSCFSFNIFFNKIMSENK